jgi:hypothetical protein
VSAIIRLNGDAVYRINKLKIINGNQWQGALLLSLIARSVDS